MGTNCAEKGRDVPMDLESIKKDAPNTDLLASNHLHSLVKEVMEVMCPSLGRRCLFVSHVSAVKSQA